MSDTNEEAQVRPFAAVLQELAKGQVHSDASQQLHDLIDAVQETGKPGSLTIKLSVAPIDKGDTSVLLVKGTVASRAPSIAPASAFFVDDSGNLSRRDPRQGELPFEVVGSSDSARSAAQ